MKRSVAFLAAVCLSAVLSAQVASAQYSPPPSQPPTQTPPPPPSSDASGDTLRTKSEPPAKAPAPTDTMSAAAKSRRTHLSTGNPRSKLFSLSLGSAINSKPDEFNANFRRSFGGMLIVGVRQHGVQAAINFNYNFFLAQGTIPNDLNTFMIFGDLAYIYGKSTLRPYVLVCGGYYRQWIVNLGYTENVLGYGGGGGLEMQIDKTRRLFLEGRYIEGQTRQIEPKVNPDMSNTVIIPFRLGVTWEFR